MNQMKKILTLALCIANVTAVTFPQAINYPDTAIVASAADAVFEIDQLPMRWSGEYDGQSDDIAVRRNLEIRVQEVAEDYSFTGTAVISPSDKSDAQYAVNGSYYIKGTIDPETGKISASGYEWIDRPSSNFSFVQLSGNINPETFAIEGETDKGIWLMEPVQFHYEDLCGAWDGTYTGNKNSTNIEREIRLDIDKCTEDGIIEGSAKIDGGENGSYIFDGTVDFETGEVKYKGTKWIDNPDNFSFADFDGILNTKTLTISGTTDNSINKPFTIRKISDIYDSPRIDLSNLPRNWTGDYDGHSNNIVVRRNYELHIAAIDENGDFQGTAAFSPSELGDPELAATGSYKMKGNIDLRTGNITMKGYEWIEKPEDYENFDFALLKGHMDAKNYTISGTSDKGVWNMQANGFDIIDFNKLPKKWKGTYDGFSGENTVKRNLEMFIDTINEDGDFEGTASLSTNEDVNPEYRQNGSYKMKGHISADTGAITMQGYEWINEPEDNGTHIMLAFIGDIDPVDFVINGTSEKGEWSMKSDKAIDFDKLPMEWAGTYDGFSGENIIKRNLEMFIDSINKDGDFEGTASLSTDEDVAPEYIQNGSYKMKGHISADTGAITMQGYEWINEPEGNGTHNMLAFSGNIDPIKFEINGTSEKGNWFMKEKITVLPGDADEDGTVSVADCVLLQNFLLGKNVDFNWQAVDMNHNDQLDIFDLILLKSMLLN